MTGRYRTTTIGRHGPIMPVKPFPRGTVPLTGSAKNLDWSGLNNGGSIYESPLSAYVTGCVGVLDRHRNEILS
jgi:hypothetical protein